MREYIVGITGASGSVYGLRIAEALLDTGANVRLAVTDAGSRVMQYEIGRGVEAWAQTRSAGLILEDNADLFSPAASGSHRPDGMVIAPCSMATLARIAHGVTTDLVARAADVALKQRYPLVLVPRETPLSVIHLRNMLALAECGAVVLPAMPAFYGRPLTVGDMVDFVAGKALDALGIDHSIYKRWEND